MPRGKLRANYCVISKLSFTNVLPVPTWCLAFCPFVTPPMEMLQNSFLQHLHFFSTCCFFENNVLFPRKRRVVFSKTTYCFFENDVLFPRKWRVVSSKTTCCFFKNDVSLFQNDRSFSMDVWEWKSNIEERENEYREFYCEKSYNHPSSRARVRAHHRSFYLFAVTSVTVFLTTRYYSVCYDCF